MVDIAVSYVGAERYIYQLDYKIMSGFSPLLLPIYVQSVGKIVVIEFYYVGRLCLPI